MVDINLQGKNLFGVLKLSLKGYEQHSLTYSSQNGIKTEIFLITCLNTLKQF